MKYYLHVLQNYFNFKGRARRKEYWMFFLFNLIIGVGLSILDSSMGLSVAQGSQDQSMIGLAYNLLVLIPSLAVAVRRMHDVNKSGWFILIPIYNLILALTAGTEGSNEYGPDPKNPEPGISDHLVS